MPIGGFYGPYSNGDYNYVNETCYEYLKAAGINLINYSWNTTSEADWDIGLKQLELADKCGIGMFVDDFDMHVETTRKNGWAGPSQDIEWGSEDALSVAEVAQKYARYSYFANCFGIHVMDA